jgi:radical SAM protein with 4Fe4S-binding SPASM domain
MKNVRKKLAVLHNQFLQVASYGNRSLLSMGKPLAFQIEATNYCNLRCPMCPHDLMEREVGYMSFDLFKRVIDEVRGYSTEVRLHNMGESLFHRQIDQLIEYAKVNDIKTVLSSNASALTERAAVKILDAGLDELLISFDGASKETYEFLREGARYDKVLEKVEAFLALRERRGARLPRVTMSIINLPMTQAEIAAFRGRWEKRVDAVRIKPARNWDGSSERINGLVNIRPLRPPESPCSWLWTSLVVLWDGRVVPCCMDYDAKAVLGNVNDKTLEQIFNDEPMRALRRQHVEGRVNESALCRGCAWPTTLDSPLARGISNVMQGVSRGYEKRVQSV